jgi:transposase
MTREEIANAVGCGVATVYRVAAKNETEHLLSDPVNEARLKASIAQTKSLQTD